MGLGVAALLSFAATASAEAARRNAVVTEPDWLEQPTGEDIGRHYPKLASRLNIDGRAIVSCRVDSYGALEACAEESAEPSGLGFGEAAMALTKQFRMTPRTVDGRPVEGASVRIPIRFTMPEVEVSPPVRTPVPPAALEAARRVIAATGGDRVGQGVEASVRGADLSSPGVDAATVEAGREALMPAATAIGDHLAQAMPQIYAETFTLPELQVIAAFLESPTAKLMADGRLQSGRRMNEALRSSALQVLSQARADFCRARNCDSRPTPADLRLMSAAEVIIEAPEWSENPSFEQIMAAYPGAPRTLLIAGWARLTCKVDGMGLLTACETVLERPKDLGFGPAALSLAPRYRLAPRLMAQGADGESVALTVAFPAPPLPSPSDDRLPATLPGSKALDLARELIEEDTEQTDAMRSAFSALVAMPGAGASPPEVQDEAMAAYLRAFDTWLPTITDIGAQAYADVFNEAQMRELLAFRRSPAGRAWTAKRGALAQAVSREFVFIGAERVKDARKAFCAKRKCEIS